MADTGDHFPTPDHWKRIKPADLRAECMKCGGDGREWIVDKVYYPLLKSEHVTRRFKGPCPMCSGSGRVFPRRVDL